MQTQPPAASASASSTPSSSAIPFVPPAHIKRWTGRAAPTIWLPNLAALRISAASAVPAPGQARPART